MDKIIGELSFERQELIATLSQPAIRGYSAYEIAVQLGYEGTAEEWIDDLHYSHSEEFIRLAKDVEIYYNETFKEHDRIKKTIADYDAKYSQDSVVMSAKVSQGLESIEDAARGFRSDIETAKENAVASVESDITASGSNAITRVEEASTVVIGNIKIQEQSSADVVKSKETSAIDAINLKEQSSISEINTKENESKAVLQGIVDEASSISSHPPVVSEDGFWMEWDEEVKSYKKTENKAIGVDGDSGVYLGSEEPTNPNVNVWIDPDGEADNFARIDDSAISTDKTWSSSKIYSDYNKVENVYKVPLLDIMRLDDDYNTSGVKRVCLLMNYEMPLVNGTEQSIKERGFIFTKNGTYTDWTENYRSILTLENCDGINVIKKLATSGAGSKGIYKLNISIVDDYPVIARPFMTYEVDGEDITIYGDYMSAKWGDGNGGNLYLDEEMDKVKEDYEELPKDIRINGNSILDSDKVANIPIAKSSTTLGVVKEGLGITIAADGKIYTAPATQQQINDRTEDYTYSTSYNNRVVITPSRLDYAVKKAMTDGKGAVWTDAEKASARERLEADGGNYTLFDSFTLEEDIGTQIIVIPKGTKDIKIIVECPIYKATQNLFCYLRNSANTIISTVYNASISTIARGTMFNHYVSGGYWKCDSVYSNNPVVASAQSGGGIVRGVYSELMKVPFDKEMQYSIYFATNNSTNLIPQGTVFSIYIR